MSDDSWEEDDWVNEDAECYYGAEFCEDPDCRDYESCIGCEVLYTGTDDCEDGC